MQAVLSKFDNYNFTTKKLSVNNLFLVIPKGMSLHHICVMYVFALSQARTNVRVVLHTFVLHTLIVHYFSDETLLAIPIRRSRRQGQGTCWVLILFPDPLRQNAVLGVLEKREQSVFLSFFFEIVTDYITFLGGTHSSPRGRG